MIHRDATGKMVMVYVCLYPIETFWREVDGGW